MLIHIGRRLALLAVTFLGIVIVTILLLELMPGDPAEILAGDTASPETVERMREQLGLDRPLWSRIADYLTGLLQGDLGESPRTQTSVWSRVAATLPVTVSLTLLAMSMAAVMGIGAGLIGALNQGRFIDRLLTAVAATLQAIPPFLIGLVLVVALAVDRSLFPPGGYAPLAEGPWEWLRHLLLPAFTLALGAAAELARQTRGALIDVFDQDYVRALRARGVAERVVLGKHAAKNAATQVVTVLGLQIGRLLGGTVVIELIFALPGFGALSLQAVMSRDLVLIQGVVLVGAVFVLLANLLVDLSYGYFNPKVRA